MEREIKHKYLFGAAIIIFAIIELYLMKSQMFTLGILAYFIILMLLFKTDKMLIVTFFVFQLPLHPVISSEYKLLSIIGPHEIVYGFSFYFLYHLNKNYKSEVNFHQKISIQFVKFLCFIQLYVLIKDIVLGHDTGHVNSVIYITKNIIRSLLYYGSLIILIKIIYQKKLYNYVLQGMKISVIFLLLSMIFSEVLIFIGANIHKKERFLENLEVYNENTRFLGFFGAAGGDENSAGVFLAAMAGFFLAIIEKSGRTKELIIYLGLAIFGVLLTGSRTAVISLLLVLFLFFYSNREFKIKFTLIIAVTVMYFVFLEQINLVVERFLDPSASEALDPNEKGRVGKWIYYMDWIVKNPETLLFGNLTEVPYNRAPHNYFIFILYHTGLVPLLIFVNLVFRLYRQIEFKFSKYSLRNAYYLLPFPLILMTVNSFGSSIYLWIYLPMGAWFVILGDNVKKEKK